MTVVTVIDGHPMRYPLGSVRGHRVVRSNRELRQWGHSRLYRASPGRRGDHRARTFI